MTDIATRADCERLVREFYTRAFADPIIGFLFTDIAKLDLEAHVPRITSFWETVLLGNKTYSGGAFGAQVGGHVAPYGRARGRRGTAITPRRARGAARAPAARP